jgi:radical SAM superfamily enzyme YgiQ (UPF0313 family)
MDTIKVLLGDPRHHTVGVHSTYVPVGIGYIATCLSALIPSQNFEVKISVNTDEILNLIDDWKPNILGFSSYLWNSNLSYRFCEYAKEKNDDILCILGGPEFPSGTNQTSFSETVKKDCLDYLKEKPCIDYYTYSDGESAFASIVKKYIKTNFSSKLMKDFNVIAEGSMNLCSDKQNLLIGEPILRMGFSNKIDGRDFIQSPYLNGSLDKFLNGKFIPSFETARGCPFFCTFCDQGLDEAKIVSFSTKRMCEELDYIAERVTKFNGTRSIAFHDSNWGMYKKDLDLSDHLLKLINEKDWPMNIEISTPKNKKQQIFAIDKKLKYRVQIALSQQSMNRDTLKQIKRDNIETNEQYIDFVKEIEKRNKNPTCALIIPLPDETKQTYFESVKELMDSEVGLTTFTLMMLQGAELGREDAIKKYGMKSKWRIVPRDFGDYRGKKVFDVERVCVATDTMSFEDYIICRRFSLIIDLFCNSVFFPLIKLIREEFGISHFEFVKAVFDNLEKNNNKEYLDTHSTNKFSKIYFDFSRECEQELFDSKEDIYTFYSKDENYNQLLSSELGDNLLRKYSTTLICNALTEVINLSIYLIPNMIVKDGLSKDDTRGILNSLKLWLTNLYVFDALFDWEKEKNNETEINLEFDVPTWFQSNKKNILNFKKKINYKLVCNKRNEDLKDEILALFGNKDTIFSVGKYFHTTGMGLRSTDDIKKSSVRLPVRS